MSNNPLELGNEGDMIEPLLEGSSAGRTTSWWWPWWPPRKKTDDGGHSSYSPPAYPPPEHVTEFRAVGPAIVNTPSSSSASTPPSQTNSAFTSPSTSTRLSPLEIETQNLGDTQKNDPLYIAFLCLALLQILATIAVLTLIAYNDITCMLNSNILNIAPSIFSIILLLKFIVEIRLAINSQKKEFYSKHSFSYFCFISAIISAFVVFSISSMLLLCNRISFFDDTFTYLFITIFLLRIIGNLINEIFITNFNIYDNNALMADILFCALLLTYEVIGLSIYLAPLNIVTSFILAAISILMIKDFKQAILQR